MLMYMLSPSLPTLPVSVVGVHAAIRTGLFTPDKAFEVVVRKRIVSLKAPTDIVVRLVTEEVLKICQAGFAQVTAPLRTRELQLGENEKHCTGMSCFCVRKAPLGSVNNFTHY